MGEGAGRGWHSASVHSSLGRHALAASPVLLTTAAAAAAAALLTPAATPPPLRPQVRSRDDVLTCARHMHADSLAPIFLTSSVTGRGLDLIRLFYNLLPQRHNWCATQQRRRLGEGGRGRGGAGQAGAGLGRGLARCAPTRVWLAPPMRPASPCRRFERTSEHAEFIIDETFGVPGAPLPCRCQALVALVPRRCRGGAALRCGWGCMWGTRLVPASPGSALVVPQPPACSPATPPLPPSPWAQVWAQWWRAR